MGIYVKITLWICFLVIWSFSHKSEFVKTYFFSVFSDRKKPDITGQRIFLVGKLSFKRIA